jgi:hypothetical protein
VETSADMYLSDVFSVMESGKPETASIKMVIQLLLQLHLVRPCLKK